MLLATRQKKMNLCTVPIFTVLPVCPSATAAAALEQIATMGDMGRKALRIQQLSEFALSDSLRDKVGTALRKRTKTTDCEEENGNRKEEVKSKGSAGHSSSCGVLVKVRSTRAKLSEKVDTRPRVVKPKRLLGQLQSTNLKKEEVQISGLSGVNQEVYETLDASFYQCDALELAPKLLGKLLRRDDVVLQITEAPGFLIIHRSSTRNLSTGVLLAVGNSNQKVEAYRPGDSACHGRVGQTARTAPLFGPAGHAYVYLCYGMHVMLNVVADNVGVGAAVLIRSCSPVTGLTSIQLRRGQVTQKPVLLTGPGKVGQALGLTTEWSTHPLYTPGGLEILNAPAPATILVGPRVGIDYAEPKDVAALWRFAIAETPWVSAPRSTLRLLQLQ